MSVSPRSGGDPAGELPSFFPSWDRLPPEIRAGLLENARERTARRGEALHDGTADCTGLLLVRAGLLRVFLLSEEGREATLYRLGPGEVCLFSASCAFRGADYDLFITADREASLWAIPSEVFETLTARSPLLAGCAGQLMAERFAQVARRMEEILWRRVDQRLAALLLEELAAGGSPRLTVTHEELSRHLGCAREVVTRALNGFRAEGSVRLGRGTVEILDAAALARLTE